MTQLPDLRAAYPPAPAHYAASLRHTLDHLEELSMKKRHRISMAVIILVLILAVGAALATGGFGVLKSLSYTDSKGQNHEPEALAPYVQTIGQTFAGSQTALTIHDAICDGKTLSLAWTLTGEDADFPLYLYWAATVNDGQVAFDGGCSFPGDEYYWKNNEPIDGSLSYSLNPALETGTTARVDLTFAILKPTGEIVTYDGISDTATQAEAQRYMENLQADIDANKFVLEGGEPMVRITAQADESPADAMLRLNMARSVDRYETTLSIPITAQTISLLENGNPMILTPDGYTVSLLQADLSPLQLDVAVEYAFQSEAAVTAFRQEREYFFYTLLFDGEPDEFSNSSGLVGDPAITDDGRYVIRINYTFTRIRADSAVITLLPEVWVDGNATTYPGEAFTLRVK